MTFSASACIITRGGDIYMDYADYRQSRDMTWRLLLKHDVTALPVRVGAICRAEGLTVISYHDADPLIRQYGLTEHAAENDGFTLGKIIFYDNTRCTPERQRFTIAHELGHIMLHHSGKLKNREPADGDAAVEQAANVFASRLLAPACVLWGCGVHTPEQIAELCSISLPAARFRAARMAELYDREQDFLMTRGRSCFLLSPLERQVYEAFADYIAAHRRGR